MKARVIALYLPQFHPIPENDRWWGPGFTEWTNVAKAKPLYKGHTQPRIPADLGFYDLRMPEVREQQALLAREAGIEGFCYYHYWFAGKQLLERPFNEVLASGKPDFPFCLCWANHSWTSKTWTARSQSRIKSSPRGLGDGGNKQDIPPKGGLGGSLMEQTYPGEEDDIAHFMNVLPAFKDKRYITVDGKPLFILYNAWTHTRVKEWISTWRRLAEENGLPGLHLVCMCDSTLTFRLNADGTRSRVLPNTDSSADLFNTILSMGFDALNSVGMRRGELLCEGKWLNLAKTVLRKSGIPVGKFFDYSKTVRGFFAPEDRWENVYPTIMPNWDRSPRAATLDGIYVNATPKAFEKHILHAMDMIKDKETEHRILILKSWNEWGEGNYVEPDLEFGHGWLDAIRHAVLA